MYRKEYCKKLINHMSQGMSYESFGAVIGVGRSTMYDWEKEKDKTAWVKAKKCAQEKAMHFFESRLIAKVSGMDMKGVDAKKIDTACLIFALKTRFHKIYSEKTETEISGSVSIVIDSDDAAV